MYSTPHHPNLNTPIPFQRSTSSSATSHTNNNNHNLNTPVPFQRSTSSSTTAAHHNILNNNIIMKPVPFQRSTSTPRPCSSTRLLTPPDSRSPSPPVCRPMTTPPLRLPHSHHHHHARNHHHHRIPTTTTSLHNHYHNHNHKNLWQECVRLVTRGSGRMLLGIASLLVTWLLTASPYERMALEKFSKSYDLPEDVFLQKKPKHLRLGAPDVAIAPIFKSFQQHVQLEPRPFLPLEKIQVHFLADATLPDTSSKFILDGLERSEWFEITAISIAQLHATERQLASLRVFERNPQLPLLYMVDWGSMNRDCGLLQALFNQTTAIQYTSNIILVDFSASYRHTQCAFLEDYKRVKYTKRSVVEKRYFDTTFQWVYPGQLVQDDTIHYAPLVLRESFVDLMHNVTTAITNTSTTTTFTPSPKIEKNNNLLFNWKPGDNSHYGFLRRLVAEKVLAYGGNVTSFAGSDLGYVRALLQTKICVLAQRDEWEGQYRLLEAMASGAMVLTDPMLALPAHFQNGTNLVVYRNLKELKHYIRYYLSKKGSKKRQKIAQKGYEAVMGHDRSWHRMEEIVFGQAFTSVNQPNEPAPLKRERPELKLIEHH